MYAVELWLDLGDLGMHRAMARGTVERTEHGHTRVQIVYAEVHLDGRPNLAVTDLLSRSAQVDIEEKLAEQAELERKGA